MTKPRCLDLFCGGGGASMGLARAGFEVVGVDLSPQPHYPFAFVQADATAPPFRLADFAFIWASPPCQRYTWSTRRSRDMEFPDLVGPVRDMLQASGRPWAIENVPAAPIRRDLVLTGLMFGLQVIRRRAFELSFFTLGPTPPPKRGTVGGGDFVTVAGHGGDNAKGRGGRAAKQTAMGIDWLDGQSLNEAIPPAYGEFIGRAALGHIA
jgi:DNA (cytosine-5)-methyltransferase 1